MNPNELAKLKEKAPLPLILLLLLFFLPAFLLEPETAALNATASGFDASLKKAKDLRLLHEKYTQQNTRLKRLQQINSQLLENIPQEAALPGMIDKLHNTAAACSVVVENVHYSFSRQYEKLDVPGYEISMNLSAGYDGIRRLLAELETMPSPVLIKEVVLTESQRYVLTMRLLVK
ncbi:MAG: type 4a pilus biogenesis protein PilO [Candidatus Riflebacteria bacterium]|nr:type 4a pilus biogenesis protein PilO [Candidatus Riflebacteria bacterium]